MDHANSPVNIIEGVMCDVESKNDFGGEMDLYILLELTVTTGQNPHQIGFILLPQLTVESTLVLLAI